MFAFVDFTGNGYLFVACSSQRLRWPFFRTVRDRTNSHGAAHNTEHALFMFLFHFRQRTASQQVLLLAVAQQELHLMMVRPVFSIWS
jgi:hypothetical protein